MKLSPTAQHALIATVITALVASLAVNGYLLFKNSAGPNSQGPVFTVPPQSVDTLPTTQATSTEDVDSASTTIIDIGQLTVDWKTPRKATEAELSVLPELQTYAYGDSELGPYAIIGNIQEPAEFKDYYLVLYREDSMGGFIYRYFAVAPKIEQKSTDIKYLHADEYSQPIAGEINYRFTLGDQKATAKNGVLFFQSASDTSYLWDINPLGFSGPDIQIEKNPDGLPIYRNLGSNYYSVLLKNGLVVHKAMNLFTSEESFLPVSKLDLNLTVSSGTRYILGGIDLRGSGCGTRYSAAYVDTKPLDEESPKTVLFTKSDLKKISDSLEIYQVINKNHPAYKAAYETWYAPDWVNGQKPSYEKFLETKPLPFFLYKDVMGHWTTYTAEGVAVVAECGKPVIYLYPTTTTEVSVKLPPTIDVTVSEPTYPHQGWTTVAEPNGQLTMADGNTYGSLFWEGYGATYKTPTTGFIVKGNEVESFLQKTLAQYGLNAQESKDFMDFWVPIMKPYNTMRISFVTDEWSKNVPLSVSPEPQTSIRIFMDWSPVSSNTTIKAPTITTPSRDGYTLVEWGGLLRK
jgi:hypothetical protein